MRADIGLDVAKAVEPDRVHRSVYTDPEIFEREMERIFEQVWVYCGHESQVPNAGDYCAVTIGRQPMMMVRQPRPQRARAVQPLPASRRAGLRQPKGNTGNAFVCSYHAWSFHLDGKVRAIPLEQGLRGHADDARQPGLQHEARAARVDSYRGFVFASLAADGPSLVGVPRRREDRLRRHVRPLAGGRGRSGADLPPRRCSSRTGSSSWRTSSMRCTRR